MGQLQDIMNAAESEPIIPTSTRTVACDGGTLGHPRVFLTLGDDDRVVCPYCSRTYVLEAGDEDTTGG